MAKQGKTGIEQMMEMFMPMREDDRIREVKMREDDRIREEKRERETEGRKQER